MTPTQALLKITTTEGTLASDIRSLIRQGANVNARTKDGITPLLNAAMFLNRECIQILIDAGATVNARTNPDFPDSCGGTTALIQAVRSHRDSGIVNDLINAGADLNVADTDGRTALMYAAAMINNPAIVETLVTEGANINQRDKYGWTALDLARKNNSNPAIARLLVEMGAK
ncbi:MAG: ankyrin repeat domain-containing protein [Synergistaceae bacterium]|nr:ankyrin repeat domain-containing protein [Synergistaceae bacterium]